MVRNTMPFMSAGVFTSRTLLVKRRAPAEKPIRMVVPVCWLTLSKVAMASSLDRSARIWSRLTTEPGICHTFRLLSTVAMAATLTSEISMLPSELPA